MPKARIKLAGQMKPKVQSGKGQQFYITAEMSSFTALVNGHIAGPVKALQLSIPFNFLLYHESSTTVQIIQLKPKIIYFLMFVY